ncbi:MAG: GNAT family N-acetyltransferase [Chloroflexi bacterium]|nr:GNAT family N-acetyltransferase [Chloroflexota bacterium]
MIPSERPVAAHRNHLGQPVGAPVDGWTPREPPPRTPMVGRFCRLEPLDSTTHADDLYEAHSLDTEGRNWTYLPYGPFASTDEVADWIKSVEAGSDPQFFAIVDLATTRAAGWTSFHRIDPPMGCIEIGHVACSPVIQRTPASTEATYLMLRRVFDELGYRRCEWKCNAYNAPSWDAAERLGFRYEGIFRQNWVQRGRNRDNAWFAIIYDEWPGVRAALENWLDPANFDETNTQRHPLAHYMPRE